MTIDIVLLGTGSPMPDPNRAGPATLVSAGGEHDDLVDAGRGVPSQRMRDTLVLTHDVPPFPPGGDDGRALAATEFDGRIELGDDLHRVTVEALDLEIGT